MVNVAATEVASPSVDVLSPISVEVPEVKTDVEACCTNVVLYEQIRRQIGS